MNIESLVGDLPVEWTLTTLGEICQRGGGLIQTGPFGSQLHAADYVPVGIPSIMPQNIGDNRVVPDGIARITAEDAKRLNRYLVKPGDIVYSRRGDVERRALITENEDGWLCGTGCLRVRFGSFEYVDPLYASFYLGHSAVREWIVRHAIGATMPNLNTSILSALPFALPSLPEQRTIADVLGSLDDKIELNRRMNQTLEALARALFKSWFVDFDPVRAKAEGRAPAGMDAETAALFPNKFVDTELGEIPINWEVKTIDEIAKRVGMGPFGSSIKVETFVDDGIPIISGPHLRGFMLEDSTFNFISVEHAEKLKNANVFPGDVIFTHAGNIGNLAFIPADSQYRRYVVSQRQFFMRCDLSKITPGFITYYFQAPDGLHKLLANSSSVGVPSIAQPVTYLKSIKLPIPPKEILDIFEEIVTPLHQKYSANKREANTVAALRDALLPRLMSGEVRVKDVEKEL